MAKREKLDLTSVEALLGASRADAMQGMGSSTLQNERTEAINYYNGIMTDLKSAPGRSKAVSLDVFEAIEGMLPFLMDIFCGSDTPVMFNPIGPEDEAAAQQETDYVNHIFMVENAGFMVLLDMFKDALMQKRGFVKVWWDDSQQRESQTFYDLTEGQYLMAVQQVAGSMGMIEIVAQTIHAPGDAQPKGYDKNSKSDSKAVVPSTQPSAGKLYDITLRSTKSMASAKVLGVAPEDFGIERNARSLKSANYAYHDITTKTEGDLIADGYDEDQVMAMSTFTGNTDIETTARDTVDEHNGVAGVGGDETSGARLVYMTEHYIRMDYEGDGYPCLYLVQTSGQQGEVLRRHGKDVICRIDAIPFASCTPIPIPHRFWGKSISDVVVPLQREKTAVKRGTLDNTYMRNNPRVEVAQDMSTEKTIDDLLVARPGGVIRTKTPGGLNWQVVPDVSATGYQMLQYIDSEIEARSGTSKQSQGLDADALQNQSATAVTKVFNASQARTKLIARVLAEGVKEMFLLLHAVVRKHGGQVGTVRLRNKWVDVDPTQWGSRNDMTIDVGLGVGGKAEQFVHLNQIANVQKQFVQAGMTHIVSPDELYATASEMTKVLGYVNPSRFFKDPTAKGPDGQLLNPPPQAQQSPALQLVAAKTQAEMAVNAQEAQLDSQHEQDQARSEITISQVRAMVDQQTAAMQAKIDLLTETVKAHRSAPADRIDLADKTLNVVAKAQKHRRDINAPPRAPRAPRAPQAPVTEAPQ